MAITRRQFVTRLGALAAAAGFSQSQVAAITETLAYSSAQGWQGTLDKPRVVWLHGAECTGCSTSVLGIFEDVNGKAIEGAAYTVGGAVGLAGVGTPLIYKNAGYSEAGVVTIEDVVVDVIDLMYHETVMGMGADLAAKWLNDFDANNTKPFVLVVEGAIQPMDSTGAWNDTGTTKPWCSIAHLDGGAEIDFPTIVKSLAEDSNCAVVVPIGQCACYGGYPACKPPISQATAEFDSSQSQTGARGTADWLAGGPGAAKVVNAPGCPTNPWWFILTVVAVLVDWNNGGITGTGVLGVLKNGAPNPDAVDSTGRLTAVYGTSVHGPKCSRYQDWNDGRFATKPGDRGCLQLIGCKGMQTNSLCPLHGWNGRQPHNSTSLNYGISNDDNNNGVKRGGFCVSAGHPCMACTEKGYPDSFVPFVVR